MELKGRRKLPESLMAQVAMTESPLLHRIGVGTGVSVLRYAHPGLELPKSPWAMKRIKAANINDKHLIERLAHEADILRTLSHPNVIGFRGMDATCRLTIFMEDGGESLGDLIEERYSDGKLLPPNTILKVARDIAEGLRYLHVEKRLLHGDVKSFNVLIKNDFAVVKICDFGVSLPLDHDGKFNQHANPKQNYCGTQLWLAPEVINDVEVIDDKADIFSFGLVVYEMMALVPPHTLALKYPMSDDESDLDLTPRYKPKRLCLEVNTTNGDMDDNECDITTGNETENDMDITDAELDSLCGTRPALPADFDLELYRYPVEIFEMCTKEESKCRPSAERLLLVFDTLRRVSDISELNKTDREAPQINEAPKVEPATCDESSEQRECQSGEDEAHPPGSPKGLQGRALVFEIQHDEHLAVSKFEEKQEATDEKCANATPPEMVAGAANQLCAEVTVATAKCQQGQRQNDVRLGTSSALDKPLRPIRCIDLTESDDDDEEQKISRASTATATKQQESAMAMRSQPLKRVPPDANNSNEIVIILDTDSD